MHGQWRSSQPLQTPGVWASRRRNILVILAHPDDPEFFCGGTLARWARAGHQIEYCLLTCGDKGYNDTTTPEHMSSDELCAIRHREQREAASVIGVREVHFLDRPDGYLVADLDLRREIVRIIRRMKPDILVTCDPQTLFAAYGINHPDHRAAGQAVLDAVFPAAGNAAYFPELLARGLLAAYARGGLVFTHQSTDGDHGHHGHLAHQDGGPAEASVADRRCREVQGPHALETGRRID